MLTLKSAYETMQAIKIAKPIKVDGVSISRVEQVSDLIEDNLEIGLVFSLLLNKFTVTGLSTKKLSKKLNSENNNLLETFEDFMSYLVTSVDGKDSSIKEIQSYINKQPTEYYDFLIQLASKSFKSGVGVSAYNKIADELFLNKVPDFKVQLANNITKLSNKQINNLGEDVVTEKLDGVRCICKSIEGETTFFTRDGREITGLVDIEREIGALYVKDGVFDGELLIDEDDGKAEDKFRATMKIVGSKDKEKLNLVYHVFDFIPSTSVFESQTEKDIYSMSRDILSRIMDIFPNLEYIKPVPVLDIINMSEENGLLKVNEWADKIIAEGGEGVMLNVISAPYQYKRTNNLLKVKQVSESDGEIVDTFMGQGNIKGLLGGIVVKYKDTTVRVGSGFTLGERKLYAENPEQLIGKMATYAFTTESHNENGDLSLRFPRFKAVRFDKSINDANYDN